MITVGTNYFEQAKAKIREDEKKNMGQKANAMKSTIADALINFASQDNEFAQAIVEGGTFFDCMKSIEKGVETPNSELLKEKGCAKKGSRCVVIGLSDIDVIRKAVRYYFDAAEVEFAMKIRLNPHETAEIKSPDRKKSVLEFSLDDLF